MSKLTLKHVRWRARWDKVSRSKLTLKFEVKTDLETCTVEGSGGWDKASKSKLTLKFEVKTDLEIHGADGLGR